MKLRALLFDLYGTLLEYGDMRRAWADWLEVLCLGLSRYGVEVSPAEVARACDGFFNRPEPPAGSHALTVYERRLASACGSFGAHLEADFVRELATATASAWQVHMQVDREAIPLLETLKPVCRLGLVTNFDHPPHIEAVLAETGLVDRFDAVVVSGDVGLKKPDPKILRLALARMGTEAVTSAYVGDSDEDVDAAVGAGMTAIRICRPEAPSAQLTRDVAHRETRTSGSAELPAPSSGYRRISSLREVLEVAGIET